MINRTISSVLKVSNTSQRMGFASSIVRTAPKNKKEIEAKKNADRRVERRVAQLKLDAKKPATSDLKFMSIPEALRYLRSAEVGRNSEESSITIQTRVFSERGVAPLQGAVRLPKALKETRILCITNEEIARDAALAAGATEVVDASAIDAIVAGKFPLNFDRVLATPDVELALRKAARVLGPKGLMPTTKKGTITTDMANVVASALGTQPFKEKNDRVALTIGRCDFSDAEIVKNIVATSQAIKDSVKTTKSKKPILLGHTHLSSTHGPALVINF